VPACSAQLVEPEALRQKRSAPVSSGSACSESPCPQSPLSQSGLFAALILEFAVGVIVKVLDRAGCLPAGPATTQEGGTCES
jgi:hypothetical protein